MLWTNIKRVIKSGFVSFWRNSVVSFAAVLVMTVTLFVIGSLVFNNFLLEATLDELKDKVDINVYFVTAAPEEDILSLKRSLESLSEVASVEYVSREKALLRFRARHENDQLTLQALDELGENPLGANLNIKAKETSQYEGIAEFLKSENVLSAVDDIPIIDKVNYEKNKIAIDKLAEIISTSEKSNLAKTLVLIAIALLVTFNTIRLAIYTSKDEISVMKLVGASNSYIHGPFIFEGIMYGIVSAIITLILFYPLTIWLGPLFYPFSAFGFGDTINNMTLFEYYISNFAEIFFIILGSGVILGALSSYLAVRKYLKK